MKMTEYGKGYILKDSLNSVIDWDNDIEKWTIRDDDLESLMTEDNDVVEVTRCEDCRYYNAYVDYPMGDCMYWVMEEDLPIKLPVYGNDFCSRGKSI